MMRLIKRLILYLSTISHLLARHSLLPPFLPISSLEFLLCFIPHVIFICSYHVFLCHLYTGVFLGEMVQSLSWKFEALITQLTLETVHFRM